LGGVYGLYLFDLFCLGVGSGGVQIFFLFTERDEALLELLTQNAESIKEVVTGCLIGDGSCVFSGSRSVNARFSFAQSIIHSGYLYFVFMILINFCTSIPKLQAIFDKRYNKFNYSLKFQTLSLPIFTQLHQLFYNNGGKVVPTNIESLMTDVFLAFWAQLIPSHHYSTVMGVLFTLMTFSLRHLKVEIIMIKTLRNL